MEKVSILLRKREIVSFEPEQTQELFIDVKRRKENFHPRKENRFKYFKFHKMFNLIFHYLHCGKTK